MLITSATLMGDGLSDYIGHSEAVANKEISPKISIDELASIYTGRISHWEDGSRVFVVLKPLNDPSQKSVVFSVLGVSIAKFSELVTTSDNMKIVSKASLVTELSKHKGSLGIVSFSEVLLCTDAGLVKVEIVE